MLENMKDYTLYTWLLSNTVDAAILVLHRAPVSRWAAVQQTM